MQTTITVPVPRSVLDASLRAGVDLPHSCREGICGMCRAKLTKGPVRPHAGELVVLFQDEGVLADHHDLARLHL
ncbi:2Fe-2S iron-sulfur cluster-binding protein [Streptomyces sp. BP-8]|uniref:2Fe-2S iron-sulfur cluster-binding protein n=1 Tax=Streptomyces sirii TaxID=3127701 RepID=UPI00388F5B36